jgi:ribosomal-protein-alanine N-acetyltransferase
MAETRWMLTRDLDAVAAIELKSNEYYISREDLIKLLRRRSVVAMVAVEGGEDGQVVGFMIYELMNRRIHLIDIAVHYKYRNQGIGSELIDRLKGKLSHKRRTKITVESRETNLGVQLFLKKNDFVGTEVLRDYFTDTNEDAFVMQYTLKGGGEHEQQG